MLRNHLFNPIILLCLVAGLALPGCAGAEMPAQAAASHEPLAVPVGVAPAVTGDVATTLSFTGNLQPVQTLDVSAKYSDEVVELHVDVGDQVQRGDVLLLFDTTPLALQLDKTQAALDTAQARLAKMRRGTRSEQIMAAQATLNLAQADLSRLDNVSEAQIQAAAGLVAQAQATVKLAQTEYDKIAWADQAGMTAQGLGLEKATTAYETAMSNYNAAVKGAPIQRLALEASLLQAQSALALARDPFLPEDYAMAESEVKRAQADLELIQNQLDDARITAPIDGVIAERYVSLGDTPRAGQALFKIISNDVETIFAVEESQVTQVRVGQPAALRVIGYPGRDFPAVVTSVSPAADVKTHTFTVKVAPEDKAGHLKGGMFADVYLLVEEHTGALLIPKSAARQDGEQVCVFVVNGDRVEERPVTLGLERDQQVEVLSGLSAGEQVVTAGLANLTDGSSVKVVTSTTSVVSE